VQVREEAMSALDTSQVIYTSDVIKLTIERVEGLPGKCRGKQMLAEVTYQDVMQATWKRVAKDKIVECVHICS
jgi:hypothetical protein